MTETQKVVEWGAGVLMLGVVVWFIRGLLGTFLVRQKNQASNEKTAIEEMRTQNTDLMNRNRELNDRYHAAMEGSLKMASAHTTQMMTVVEDIRRKHDDALARFAGRIEQCEVKHGICESEAKMLRDEQEEMRAEITELRSLIPVRGKRARA